MNVLKTTEAAVAVGKGLQDIMGMVGAMDIEWKKIKPFLNAEHSAVIGRDGDASYILFHIFAVYEAVVCESLEANLSEKTLKLAE